MFVSHRTIMDNIEYARSNSPIYLNDASINTRNDFLTAFQRRVTHYNELTIVDELELIPTDQFVTHVFIILMEFCDTHNVDHDAIRAVFEFTVSVCMEAVNA